MRVLIIAAHGSRRKESNKEVVEMSKAVSKQCAGYEKVHTAFLELALPSIEQCIDQAVGEGAKHITVFPYFLAAGRHVAEDIPDIVVEKKEQYPNISIELASYLGEAPRLPGLIADLLSPEQ